MRIKLEFAVLSHVLILAMGMTFVPMASAEVQSVLPAPSATLHIIKLVVNGSGGTASPSDFNVHVENAGEDVLGSPATGVASPGRPYSLYPGTYTIRDDSNSSYIQSFAGDCDSNGIVILSIGDDKTCTIINTNIPVPTPVVPAASGGISFAPLVSILNIPTPLALHVQSGSVTYNYAVQNIGQPVLNNITVTDDKCSPLVFVSGDVNSNGNLDPGEIWRYKCSTILLKTTTNTAIATGRTDSAVYPSQTAIATAIATVVVGVSPGLPDTGLIAPLINIVEASSRLTPFPYGGGDVAYMYTVTNPGTVPMDNVTVADDECDHVLRISGDPNNNGLLDPGEAWAYACQTNVSSSTRSIATAKGQANGFTALNYGFVTVLVSAAPGFPNTGSIPPIDNTSNIPWVIIILSVLLAAVSISLVVVVRKGRT